MSEISEQMLKEAIYKKYIVPTQRPRRSCAGAEFELPIVNLDRKPVDFTAVHALTDAFIGRFSFDTVHKDDNGDIYSALSSENGDSLSYDCSYNTLELSFGVVDDLNVLYERFAEYYSFISEFLAPYNHTLTGMGINPHYAVNNNIPIPNGRYRMLLHHLESYKKYGDAIPFHNNPNFGLFSCASQVQLDVEEDMIPLTLNTFTRLEPLKSLLFANSLWGDLLCSRDNFWKNSLHGLNRRNVDMYETEFTSAAEVQDYIGNMSIYCVERGDKYINFPPTPLKQYFASAEIKGEYYDGSGYKEITFQPRIEDLEYLRSFKFEDLTYRGTVEFRSVCAQPVGEIMGPAAFHVGLMRKLPELAVLLESDNVIYNKGYGAVQLRELFNRRDLPAFIDRKAVSGLLVRILDIAKSGLEQRGQGEERFLEKLYPRAETLCSPARQMADGLDIGVPPEYFIKEFAKL